MSPRPCIRFPRPTRKRLGLIALAAVLFAAGGAAWWVFHDLPPLSALDTNLAQPSVRITDRNGRLLYEILPTEGGRNAVLPAASIPECLKQATIAVEDRNFYTNPGVDPEGILRALWIDVQGGETIAGGSTITQQVARYLLLSADERNERSLRRKLREAALAWELTQTYSKEEILALYLNQTYYGGFAYGVEAASETYFGKPAVALMLPECALLAGLPQAPGLYNPYTNPDLALERRNAVLELMAKTGSITPAQLADAKAAPLYLNPAPYPIEAPHFVWLVRRRLDELFASGALDPRASLVVRTTLDLDRQTVAEQVITRQIAAYKRDTTGVDRNVNNAALVALDPHTGEVLALVGSAGYFDAAIDGAVDMAVAPRQPGSAFKPFLYAQALDPNRADPWTAATILLDVGTTFPTHNGLPYTPVDYDGREHGPVPVRQALASSLNIPAVLTLDHVGIADTINLARRLGITTLSDPDTYDLSLALGGGQMSLLALTAAYGAFADGGDYTAPTILLDVRDPTGNVLYTEPRPEPVPVFDPRVAWLITNILSDDRARTVGFGRNSTLQIGRTAAVKTGTTTNFHDNWTIGYTPDLLAGVWVGNSDYQAMHNVTGLTGAAPIWHEFLRAALQGVPDKPFPQPDGLVSAAVCDLSGLLPTAACPNTHIEWFIDGTQPTTPDNVYREVAIDMRTGRLADVGTPITDRRSVLALDLPLSVRDWARSVGLILLSDLSPSTDSIAGEGTTSDLLLIAPTPNATYRLDPAFAENAQQLAIEAIAGSDFVSVSLWADGDRLAEFSTGPYQAWWPLAPGIHRFWVTGTRGDGSTGTSPTVSITVVTDSTAQTP